MRLLYDLSATQSSASVKNHGGAEYSIRIYKKLLESANESVIIDAVYDDRNELSKEISILNEKYKINLKNFHSVEELGEIIKSEEYDKFYSGLGYEYQDLSVPESCQLLITIHGLRFLETVDDEYKGYFDESGLKYKYRAFRDKLTKKNDRRYKKRFLHYKNLLAKLKSNGKIIVVSSHTKNSILSFFDEIKNEDVEVFYSPEKISSKYEGEIEKKKYFLVLSANRWEKNSIRALLALDDFFNRKENKEFRAVILGNAPDSIKKELNNIQNFEFRNYVSSSDLERLYAEAFALFYPSLNEGFGYPPLEAMKYGTPVITSAITSIPEVCGDAAIYFNPYSIKEMKARLLQLRYGNYDDYVMRSLARYEYIKNKQEEDLERLIKMLIDQL